MSGVVYENNNILAVHLPDNSAFHFDYHCFIESMMLCLRRKRRGMFGPFTHPLRTPGIFEGEYTEADINNLREKVCIAL